MNGGQNTSILLLPDAGPLITLAYADALDLLFRPGWSVHIVDMVLHEVTRNHTPTSQAIAAWVQRAAGPPQGELTPSGLMPAAPSLPAQGGTGSRALASGIGLYREPHAVGERGGQSNQLQILTTKTLKHLRQMQASGTPERKKSNLGELAIQEAMNDFALIDPPPIGVFLFEDHKIARSGFLLPSNCRKVSTRAFLIFLEQKGWLESAADIERNAIQNGRNFSQLRFPPA